MHYETIDTIDTGSEYGNEILVHSSDGGDVITIEADCCEFFPFAILANDRGKYYSIVTAAAWKGYGVPESAALIDPKANDFAHEVERMAPSVSRDEAIAARNLHVQLELAVHVWNACNENRMPKNVYEFLRRLFAAGRRLGVRTTSAATFNPGCRGLSLYMNGTQFSTQVVGIHVDQFGEIYFTNCSDPGVPQDLYRLCALVDGHTLEDTTVVFYEEAGYHASRVPPEQGVLEHLTTHAEATAIAAGLSALSWRPGDTNYHTDITGKLCRIHHPLGRYLKYDGGICRCGR